MAIDPVTGAYPAWKLLDSKINWGDHWDYFGDYEKNEIGYILGQRGWLGFQFSLFESA